jgi:uncharacterized membrane protein
LSRTEPQGVLDDVFGTDQLLFVSLERAGVITARNARTRGLVCDTPLHMPRHIYGVFDTKDDATHAYDELVALRGADHCSVMIHEDFADATTDGDDTRRGAVAGAAIVGTAGAVISGLIAVGAGVLAAGPLVVAAVAVGSVYGALSGSLSGVGDVHADRIETVLREGKIVVAAEAHHDSDVEPIRAVLKRHHGVLEP